MLHDTTEFSYQREKSEAIGITKSMNSGREKAGRLRSHTVCGILMHSSLAVTIEGGPMGFAAVKFWTRAPALGLLLWRSSRTAMIVKSRRHADAG
ncbi:hypothetical protein A1D31_36630 [Bradyrhizobium liaoningense]|nr:hypothetical protein A1D31_36630 [Bradyrhizobium liaoningense]